MNTSLSALLTVCALALSGCGGDTAPPPANTDDPVPGEPAPSPGPSTRGEAVDVTGLAPIRIGMTLEEARAALPSLDSLISMEGCGHWTFADRPGVVRAMVVDGRVVRVEIDEGDLATAEGARIGSTEAEVEALYPGRVETQPHQYIDGHYLLVTPESAPPEHRYVFETDGERVLRYRAGVLPQVRWIEGCA